MADSAYTGFGRDRLLERKTLQSYLDHCRHEPIPDAAARRAEMETWIKGVPPNDGKGETTLEGPFATRVLETALGYVMKPGINATAWAKPGTAATKLKGTPDVVLGDFSDPAAPVFLAVLELKGPGADLDKPQPSYDNRTPVEQAFDYARMLDGVRWVLVSDMRVIRLYSVDDDDLYLTFDLAILLNGGEEAEAVFQEIWWLLSFQALIQNGNESATSMLLERSLDARVDLTDGFYKTYFQIRSDVLAAIDDGIAKAGLSVSPSDRLESAQRLLDRMLFIYYCEDHPQSLLPPNTVRNLLRLAKSLPGASATKVYDNLKALFQEIDSGSPPASGLNLFGYNGELFKHHWVIDEIELPDSLDSKQYKVVTKSKVTRTVHGAWGLFEFDFWRELDERALGLVFEESLSDLASLAGGSTPDIAAKLAERKKHGIYYTSAVLSDFVAQRSVGELVDERSEMLAAAAEAPPSDPSVRLEALEGLRIADLTCGSGAFLVAAYKALLDEYWKQRRLMDGGDAPTDLFTHLETTTQASLLAGGLYGIDLLPQAVEIAKLALWLRSARREEKVSDLTRNVISGDALWLDTLLPRLGPGDGLNFGDLDLVIGNPPWGAEMDANSYAHACALTGVEPDIGWDSWELFLLLGLKAVRDGGRVSLVLPDSLLYEEKARIRKTLLEDYSVQRLHVLGPGWFGPRVRMATTVLEVKKSSADAAHEIGSLLLSGKLRKRAITGRSKLSALEDRLGRRIPQARSLASDSAPIEVFRSTRDDALLQRIQDSSVDLADVCDWGRGEEMSKSGLYWICPSCLMPTVPGKKKKGGGYAEKVCPRCGATLSTDNVKLGNVVEDGPVQPGWEPFIDGDDVSRRYKSVPPTKRINMTLDGWTYKPSALYAAPKLLIRQAGVGLTATLDLAGARCPQSMYVYRSDSEAYSNEYLLACLSSRTMAYVIFKKYAEVDPDKAHAKVTHQRLERLPVPRLGGDPARQKLHDAIASDVQALMSGTATLGGIEDLRIEQALRTLWGLTGDEGAYINTEFADLPESQTIRDLFPNGVPSKP